ncbi:kelch domain-containing protein 1-like isoform X2 [Labrus bergylta]|uniref:kelch domain-containing protein 1-like isoform X2 n=1 Tax=Labrus bergylta TaxID=56723 RepID=UPI0033143B46
MCGGDTCQSLMMKCFYPMMKSGRTTSNKAHGKCFTCQGKSLPPCLGPAAAPWMVTCTYLEAAMTSDRPIRIVYFGGYGHKLLTDVDSRNRSFIVDEASSVGDIFWGWNNEVHTFDPMHSSWSQPQTHGRAPAPRAAHASATIGRRGYICGGRVMETRTNDIHCLDLESWTWSEIVPASSAPVGRSWHTLTAVSDNGLFLFGGLSVDCKPMSDGWLFDVETKTWREVEHPFKTKPRLWHSACPGKDSDVIVFGGSCDYILLVDTGHCNDALVFQTQPYPLFRICVDYIAKSARNSDPLRHQLPLLPSKLLTAVQTRMCFYRPSKSPKSESP